MSSEEQIGILIVDHLEHNRMSLAKWISFDEQFEVVGFASTDKEALERIPQLSPDVILVYELIPEHGGIELTRNISEQFPSIPVIFMVISDFRENARQAMMAGAADVLLGTLLGSQELYDTIRRAYERFGKNK